MYKIVYFDFDLRREDDYSPLIGIRFIPNEKQKLFSLLIQDYGIIWSERYKCYILPDETLFNHNELKKYIHIIDLTLLKIKNNYEIDKEMLEREKNKVIIRKQA